MSILTGVPLWSFAGFAGVAAVTGVAAWRLSTAPAAADHSHMMYGHDPEDIIEGPRSFLHQEEWENGSLEEEEPADEDLSQPPMGCVEAFFPGAEETPPDGSLAPLSPREFDPAKGLKRPSFTGTTKHELIGCSRFEWYYNARYEPFHIRGLVTMKNDRIGWALWADFRADPTGNNRTAYEQSGGYRLLLYENVDDQWEIVTGYAWSDRGMKSKVPSIIFIEPVFPAITLHSEQSIRETSHGRSRKIGVFGGFWDEAPDGRDSNPFAGITLGSIRDPKAYIAFGLKRDYNLSEMLGRSNYDFTHELDRMGYRETKNVYWNGRWRSTTNPSGFDISRNLNDWFKSFRDRRGSWTRMGVYCDPAKTRREIWWEAHRICDNPAYRYHLKEDFRDTID